MPKGYEKIRDALIAKGMDKKEAQAQAARIWNSRNPDNPVHRGSDYGWRSLVKHKDQPEKDK